MDRVATTSDKVGESDDAASMKKIIFASLKGRWRLSRTLQSSIPSFPSGKLTGSAILEERPITDDGFSNESLYSEEGDFTTDRNLTMRARRQYVYRYQQEIDRLTAWFVKSDESASVDYLFHILDFRDEGRGLRESKAGKDETILTARGHHLCVDDNYTADYRFAFQGQELTEWAVKYIVKGPHKDYVASARYTRPAPDGERVY
jgi:hypothetical protein